MMARHALGVRAHAGARDIVPSAAGRHAVQRAGTPASRFAPWTGRPAHSATLKFFMRHSCIVVASLPLRRASRAPPAPGLRYVAAVVAPNLVYVLYAVSGPPNSVFVRSK